MKKLSLSQFCYKLSALVITLLSVLYFTQAVMRHFNEIPDLKWGIISILIAFVCINLVVISIAVGGIVWRILLFDRDVKVHWLKILVIFFITQFAKYLPGNVGHHVGRVFMARKIGISAPITMSIMLIEIFWGASTAAGLSLFALLFFTDFHSFGLDGQFGAVPLCLCVGFLFFVPWFAILALNKYLPSLAKRLSGSGRLAVPKFSNALMVGLLCFLCFMMMGLIIKLQALYFFEISAGSVFELTCLFSIAWLAGYLAPGAPGGLGVREAMMVILLSPLMGKGTAVGLGITLRMTTTIGDAVAFVLGVLGRKLVIKL